MRARIVTFVTIYTFGILLASCLLIIYPIFQIMQKMKPATVQEYIDAAPAEARAKIQEIRTILRSVAPNARETLKWGTPVFEEKRILFAYAAFKDHLNFMPTRSSLVPFAKELEAFVTGKDTIQLPYDKPLPGKLIRRIAEYRYRDVMENDAKWM